MDSKTPLSELQIDVDAIPESSTRVIVCRLLNIIESQAQETKGLKEENQKLRDEINHLKGEQGKPNIRKQSRANKNISSEKERGKGNKKRPKSKKSKKKKLTVHRAERCVANKDNLPEDAVFKGFHSTIVQDIKIRPYNVQFNREVFVNRFRISFCRLVNSIFLMEI